MARHTASSKASFWGWRWRAPCADAPNQHCEIAINTVTDTIKAARGTKRVCQACETRFYDLARTPIACPSCGAAYTAVAAPVAGRSVSPTGKTGWRSKPMKRPKPQLPVGDQEDPLPEIAQEPAEETPSPVAEDDLVLEQEPDDADVTELVDHDIEEPKDR